jgi:hypothetical protein
VVVSNGSVIGMANALFLGGLLNITDPILHLQLYYYLWVLILVLAIVAWVIWYYGQWKPFAPLHGLYYAYKAASNVAFIFDQNLIGEMVAEKDAKCIFDYSKYDFDLSALNYIRSKLFYYPTVFLDVQGGEWERSPSAVCGGVPLDIIIDADNWTLRNSPQHKAIERCALVWNEMNPDDQIHSYSKFQKKLIAGEIECPEVKKEVAVSWTRIDAGFPMDLEESDWAGKRRQMAEQEYNQDQISKNKMALYILIAGVGLAVMIVAIRLITHYV